MSTTIDTEPSDQSVEPFAVNPATGVTFPTWPPPSGGAPVTAPELGPITNPYPYGSAQNPNISVANPAPPFNATFFPTKMAVGATGQNQTPPANWPTWPHSKRTFLPDKAPPSISQLP